MATDFSELNGLQQIGLDCRLGLVEIRLSLLLYIFSVIFYRRYNVMVYNSFANEERELTFQSCCYSSVNVCDWGIQNCNNIMPRRQWFSVKLFNVLLCYQTLNFPVLLYFWKGWDLHAFTLNTHAGHWIPKTLSLRIFATCVHSAQPCNMQTPSSFPWHTCAAVDVKLGCHLSPLLLYFLFSFLYPTQIPNTIQKDKTCLSYQSKQF